MHHAFASVQDLFSGNTRYEIPPYQREYQWGPEQWQALWRDLGSMYEQDVAGKSDFPNHFLGILLLEPLPISKIGGSVRYSVIDGQQRLTTLLILQAAIRDADNEAEKVSLPAQHGLYWVRDSNNVVEGQRLVAQEVDHEALTLAMEDMWRTWYRSFRGRKEFEASRALWAYAYFRNCIWRGRSSFVDDEIQLPSYKASHQKMAVSAEQVWTDSGQAVATADERIVLPRLQAYLQRLDVLELRIQSSDEDAPTIFESINAKRTELQQWDFIRNLIFTRFEPAEAAQIFNSSWKGIQASLQSVSWGGKRSSSRDAFIYDYLIARGEQGQQGSIGKNRGYQHLRVRMARVLPPVSSVEYRGKLATFVEQDLLRAARVWPVAVGAATSPLDSSEKPSKDALQTIESIAKLSSGPPFPVVLHLVERWHEQSLVEGELLACLRVLETYLVRMVLCKQALSPMRALFMGIMNQLSTSDDPRRSLIASLRGTSAGSTTSMPSNEAVLRSLRDEDYYKAGVSGSQLGAIFRGIERQMSGAAANPLPYGSRDSDFTVEHVLPQSSIQSPHGAWNASFGITDEDRQAMTSRVNKLGNLTLLTFDANRYLKARSFQEKRGVFANQDPNCPHPMLSISQSLSQSSTWAPEDVDLRTDNLAARIIERWPFPQEDSP